MLVVPLWSEFGAVIVVACGAVVLDCDAFACKFLMIDFTFELELVSGTNVGFSSANGDNGLTASV